MQGGTLVAVLRLLLYVSSIVARIQESPDPGIAGVSSRGLCRLVAFLGVKGRADLFPVQRGSIDTDVRWQMWCQVCVGSPCVRNNRHRAALLFLRCWKWKTYEAPACACLACGGDDTERQRASSLEMDRVRRGEGGGVVPRRSRSTSGAPIVDAIGLQRPSQETRCDAAPGNQCCQLCDWL